MEGAGADDLQLGLYDTVLTQALADQIDGLDARRLRAQLAEVEPAELPDRIAEIIAEWARDVVEAASSADRHDTAVALATSVLILLVERHGAAVDDQSRLAPGLQRLVAVEPLSPTGEPVAIPRPLTPLRDTVLMTNARDQPTVGREILAEIESADRIDLVLAFIRWTGVRDLLPALRREAAPLVGEQRAVRLDRVEDHLVRPLVRLDEGDRSPEEVEAEECGLPALPGDRDLRRGLGLDDLADEGLQEVLAHPEPVARVELFLREEEAVLTVEVADRARRLRQDMNHLGRRDRPRRRHQGAPTDRSRRRLRRELDRCLGRGAVDHADTGVGWPLGIPVTRA
jgi:hypothetical protein